MRLFILTLPLLLSACAPAIRTSGDAVCDASRQGRAVHAQAVGALPPDLLDLPPVARVAVTGANLIETMDAACGRG